MNRDKFLVELYKYLSEVVFTQELSDSLEDIAVGSGYESDFFKLLFMRLRQLSVLGVHAVNLEEFENIGSGIYSMHLASRKFNIRILYAFFPNGQPVLLLAFYERAGKKKTDYTNQIPLALSLLKTAKERYLDE